MDDWNSGRGIVAQQVEMLQHHLRHYQDMRLWYNLCACAPVAGWCGWGAIGAFATGAPVAGLGVLVLGAVVAGGLFVRWPLVQGAALICAFMISLAGPGIPMLVGGWILVGKITIALVIAGLCACYSVLNNDIQISRTRERLEELTPKAGKKPST